MPKGRLQSTNFVHQTTQIPYVSLLCRYSRFNLFRRKVMSIGKDSGRKMLLIVKFFGKTKTSQLDVLPLRFSKVDVFGANVAMDNRILVDIIECLHELIEYSPNFILRNLFVLSLGSCEQLLQRASLTVLHNDVDCDIFFIDFVIEVSDNVDVVHPDESIDFIDDMLFLLGRNAGEGDLLNDDSLFVLLSMGLV